VADALLWARKEGLANDRACIAGGSYGGYSTLMGLVRHPDLYRCGAAWVAVTDLELYVSGSIWIRDNISDVARKFSTPQMVGSTDTDAELISRNSPVLLASEIKAPLFLAFGEEDERVPLAHGKRLREALRKQSREPEWVTYPGEAHGWAMQETRLDFARRLETFLGKHLMTNSAQ
jgi:dipeptidyl aminopeptidase/acylaminoacyl peptidase